MCIFSFHAIKMITTGEGGAILVRNKKIFKKVSDLNSHGITRNILGKKKISLNGIMRIINYLAILD